MKKVKFIETRKGSYFEYHLDCSDGLLDNSLFFNEFELEQEASCIWQQYLSDSGITYFASNENSLLYSLIVKKLSSKSVIDISTFGDSRYLREYLAPIQSERIEWKNSIEFTVEDSMFCRQYGYQTPEAFLSEMNYFDRDLTNRAFNISRVKQENLDSFIKTYNSDVTSWTFFLNSDWDRLTDILQNPGERPEINELLEFSDSIVDVQIGGDEGYLDYVLIQSKTSLTEKLQLLEESITRFGESLERIISDLSPIDEEWKIDAFKESLNEIKHIANRTLEA